MKIIKIELQNINSLKSDSPIIIDFESDHFKDIGLYAITGPTGAGKTTILDAITIGLYHNVPRFNQTKANLIDVVSYGANDALVNITFENKGVYYEAHWSIRLVAENNKKLKNPKDSVRLKNLSTGKILAEKKREVITEVIRITQLNYEQFLRSVLLAQGQFAAFLSANAKEKGALLEQITGEQIYKRIGEVVLQKIRSESAALATIKADINDLDLLTDEIRTELAAKITTQEKINLQQNKELRITNNRIAWIDKKQTLEKSLEKNETSLITLAEEKENNKEKSIAFEWYEKAMPFKELITEITRIEKEIEAKKIAQEKAKKTLTKTKKEYEEIEIEKTEKDIKNKEAETTQKNWLSKLETIAQLDVKIYTQKEQKEKLETLISTINKNISTNNRTQDEIIPDKKTKEITKEEIDAFLKNNANFLKINEQINNWTTAFTSRDNKANQKTTLENRIAKLATDNTTDKDQLENDKNTLTIENNKQSPLKNKLDQISNQLKENDLNDLIKQHESAIKSIETNKEAIRLAESYIKITLKEKTRNSKQDEHNIYLEKTQEKLKEIHPKIETAKQAVLDQEKLILLEQKIINLEKEREELKEDEPCQLCGSTEHPFVDHYDKTERSNPITIGSKEELLKRKDVQNKRIEEQAELKIEEAKTKTEINQLKIEKTDLEADLRKDKAEFNSLSIDQKITAIDTINAEKLKNENTLQLIDQKIKDVQKIQDEKTVAINDLQKQKDSISDLEKTIALTEERQSLNTKQLDQDQTDFKKLNTEIETIEEDLKTKLSPLDLNLPNLSNTKTFLTDLKDGIREFQEKTKSQVTIQNEIDKLNTQLKNNTDQKKERQKELDKTILELTNSNSEIIKLEKERATLLPLEISTEQKRNTLQNSIDHAKSNLAKTQEKHSQLKTALELYSQEIENNTTNIVDFQKANTINNAQLKTDLDKSDFNALIEVEKHFLPKEKATVLKEWVNQLRTKTIELNTLKAAYTKDLANLKQEKDFIQSAEELSIHLTKLKNDIKQTQFNLGEINQKLAKDSEIRTRNKEIIKRITAQEKVLKKWTDLMTLLGGAKDKFNTYVQRLTLQNLILLANVHLFKLNKRYALKMNPVYKSGEELNFSLVDFYQSEETRPVETSSGGEKFLISLALALGLSDLASNNVKIGSLFIDEGFGTLDNNTLETVISTLETLQADGKMIGIISHVENLKERIPTQIKLVKKSNGVSLVEIV